MRALRSIPRLRVRPTHPVARALRTLRAGTSRDRRLRPQNNTRLMSVFGFQPGTRVVRKGVFDERPGSAA